MMNPECLKWLNRLFNPEYLNGCLATEVLADIRLMFDRQTLLDTVKFLSEDEQVQVKKWVMLLNAVQKNNAAIADKQPFKSGDKVITPDGEAIIDEILVNGEDITVWVKFGNLYSHYQPSEVKQLCKKH